ncbi:pirin family protein [Salmonella enterica]|nr:pirin family protein [Salmonella enterica]EBH9975149.1 pirin family protein [Salmonella enterica subsp. arizonae serovar 40:z36:-]EBL3321943.1 pirin family protein [Salmonella enterica subsp. enterica]ECI4824269.1 pirin family protein [Salmonella enterica subsp. arizonae]EDR3673556.1 pirin family protein [Salmonella enterica subsp. arizonae serovar 40:z4,z24:]EDU6452059.1 pirin family protein [Salmonella enterica subsp. arizonae serovar 41:z4,z32:-]EDW2493290.1 pirin family protein [Salmon
MKQITGVYTAPRPHWVGDGFPVRSLFSYQSHTQQLSPFLLLDYAGPHTFTPGNEKRGVGEHPHRGFETVTIVYSGEVEHRDSTGRGGVIGPGDVQWMTAGAGILHEEFHSDAFTRQGGELEMVQLWVNLPMKDKMTTPAYQSITQDIIPTVTLPDDAGTMRVIAGRYEEAKGPADTFSPLNVWDMRLLRDRQLTLSQPEGWSTALVVLKGNITLNGTTPVNEAQLVVLSQQGKTLHFETSSDASVLLLSGEPLNEPIVGYGPFVMNTKQEIAEAVRDFNSGRFGQI